MSETGRMGSSTEKVCILDLVELNMSETGRMGSSTEKV